jgi:hypothetical protein
VSGGARVDLSAARDARREQLGEGPVFAWDGVEYHGPAELPIVFVDLLREARFVDALRCVFGKATDEFVSTAMPTLNDLVEIAQAYGASLPSSLTSARS